MNSYSNRAYVYSFSYECARCAYMCRRHGVSSLRRNFFLVLVLLLRIKHCWMRSASRGHNWIRLYCKSFLICDEVYIYIRANETQTRPHTTSPIQFNSVHKKCFLLWVHRVSCVSIPHHFLLSSLSLSFCRWFYRCTKLIASQLFSVSLQFHTLGACRTMQSIQIQFYYRYYVQDQRSLRSTAMPLLQIRIMHRSCFNRLRWQ